jgi:fission process protein 1
VSDVGESFRPIISTRIVNLSYGISAAYVLGDVVYEGIHLSSMLAWE